MRYALRALWLSGAVAALLLPTGVPAKTVTSIKSYAASDGIYSFRVSSKQTKGIYEATMVVGKKSTPVSSLGVLRASEQGRVLINSSGRVMNTTASAAGRRKLRPSATSATLKLSSKKDTTPPSTPTITSGTSNGSNNTITLGWTASTDNVKLAGYQVYLSGTRVATTSSTSVTLSNAVPGNVYSYTVRAYDSSGNYSAYSNSYSVTALGPSADITPPSTPTNLTAAAGNGLVSLAWSASTDNVGVAAYEIYRNGNMISRATTTSYTDSGLVSGSTYTYTVRALDAAGNASLMSPSASATPSSTSGTLVWSDDFTGTAGTAPSGTKWNAINWCDRWGSLSCNTNRSQNISLDGNGHMKITAIKENYTDPYGNTGTWTAARAESKYKFRYGKLQASIMVPAGRGLWPAFWGVTDKASNGTFGEYDIMEILGHEPDRSYCTSHGWPSSVHWATATSGLWGSGLSTGYHLYEMVWTSSSITYKLDGVTCAVHTPTTSGVAFWPFDIQGNILLGMAVGGSWPGNPDSNTPSPASMYVDWVRVYQ